MVTDILALMNNKHYILALSHMPKIGARTICKLLNRWPNLKDLFSLSKKALNEAGLSMSIAETISNYAFEEELKADLYWEQESNHHILTFDDPKYPHLLKEISDPPPILYADGDLTCLETPAIAIVGTRLPSYIGKETAYKFAAELSEAGLVIVSGLAKGIDGYAHQACIDKKGKTIAVMATGIDRIYPPNHRLLASKIRESGLLITEFSLKNSPKAGHFPLRNRIISGLSLSTLVVEASLRSGSLITARLALEQNRDVFAIPGSIYNPQTKGCHYLLQEGAKLVTSVKDILDDLGRVPNHINENPKIPLAENDINLVKFIGFEITTIDQIVKRSGLNIEEVMCNLAQLELAGAVTAIPGGYIRSLS